MHELFDEEFYDKMDDEKPVFDDEENEFIVSIFISLMYLLKKCKINYHLLIKNKICLFLYLNCIFILF